MGVLEHVLDRHQSLHCTTFIHKPEKSVSSPTNARSNTAKTANSEVLDFISIRERTVKNTDLIRGKRNRDRN
jgi:hypothetical protein